MLAENSLATTAWFFLLHRLGRVRPMLVTLGGVKVWLRTATSDIYVAVESLGSEFDPAIALLPASCSGLVIDAGGYIGTAAIKLARAFPHARIVTIEPSSANLAILRRNVAGFANIEVMHAALAAQPGPVVLKDTGHDHWGFSIVDHAGHHKPLESIGALSLADVLEKYAAETVALLKLDIEGAEGEVLAAAADWLARVDIVVAELHDRIVPGVEAIWARAVAGRRNFTPRGEKVMSVHPRLLSPPEGAAGGVP